MKLTRPEAQLLLYAGATNEPVVNALDRVLAHDWSFDPRGSQITLLLRRYHELDQVLYHTWTRFRKNLAAPVVTGPYPLRCELCASVIDSAPFYTAYDHSPYFYEICSACVSAMGAHVSACSSVVRVFQSMDRPRTVVPRAFAALRKTLRRLFG